MPKSGNRPGREVKKASAAQRAKTGVKKITPAAPVPVQRETKKDEKVPVKAHVRNRSSVSDSAKLKSDVTILTAHPQPEQKEPTILSKHDK